MKWSRSIKKHEKKRLLEAKMCNLRTVLPQFPSEAPGRSISVSVSVSAELFSFISPCCSAAVTQFPPSGINTLHLLSLTASLRLTNETTKMCRNPSR